MLRPLVLARLIASLALNPKDKVLAVGCATGYSLVLLKGLASSICGLESDAGLASQARDLLKKMRKSPKVVLNTGLGEGAPQTSPYQAVLIEGGVQKLPDSLLMQLAEGGCLAYISCVDERIGKAILLMKKNGVISEQGLFECSPYGLPDFKDLRGFKF